MAARSTKSLRLGELRLIREVTFPAPAGFTTAVRSPRDVFHFMAPYVAREVAEVFWIIALDAQHRAIGDAPIAITRGTLVSSLVHAREVFRAAIVAGAAAIIAVHNHPSGDPTPSADDRDATYMLVEAGKLLDVPMHDHIICGKGRYLSFAEAGLI
jgi:DNA repair protein RadC